MALNVSVCPPQVGFVPAVNAIETLGAIAVPETIVIADELAVVGLAQLKLDVKTHVTACPFNNAAEVYVELFVPAFNPSTFHWYVGEVPPLVAVAVNVMDDPAQPWLDPEVTAMAIVGAMPLLVVTAIAFEVDGTPAEVITQVMLSLVNVLDT